MTRQSLISFTILVNSNAADDFLARWATTIEQELVSYLKIRVHHHSHKNVINKQTLMVIFQSMKYIYNKISTSQEHSAEQPGNT